MWTTKISQIGSEVFIGIDVHKSFYTLAIISDGELVKRCQVPAEPQLLIRFINKNFPGTKVKTCYEAGFQALCCIEHW